MLTLQPKIFSFWGEEKITYMSTPWHLRDFFCFPGKSACARVLVRLILEIEYRSNTDTFLLPTKSRGEKRKKIDFFPPAAPAVIFACIADHRIKIKGSLYSMISYSFDLLFSQLLPLFSYVSAYICQKKVIIVFLSSLAQMCIYAPFGHYCK